MGREGCEGWRLRETEYLDNVVVVEADNASIARGQVVDLQLGLEGAGALWQQCNALDSNRAIVAPVGHHA